MARTWSEINAGYMVSAVYDAQGEGKGRFRRFVPLEIYIVLCPSKNDPDAAFVSFGEGYGMSGKVSPQPLCPVVWRRDGGALSTGEINNECN